MALRINSNQSAISVRRNLNATTREISTSLERLSSGLRINRAADDAAGLSVREGLRAESAGLQASVRNTEQATNLIQTAEASLNEVNAILVRMRELAVQSSSGTVSDSNRESVQTEFSQLSNEIDRIAQSTTFNNQVLLTGFGNAVSSLSSALVASDAKYCENLTRADTASPSAYKNSIKRTLLQLQSQGEINEWEACNFPLYSITGLRRSARLQDR